MKEKIVKKWINSLCDHHFMTGWGGDVSEDFRKSQFDAMMKTVNGDVSIIGGNYRLLATIYSDYLNLEKYCGWTKDELKELLSLFGLSKIEEVLVISGDEEKCKNWKFI